MEFREEITIFVLVFAFLVLTVPIIILSSHGYADGKFEIFQKVFDKFYDNNTIEIEYRRGIFKESLDEIKRLNRQQRLGKYSVEYGVTRFADLSEEEFNESYLKQISDKQIKSTKIAKNMENIWKQFDFKNGTILNSTSLSYPLRVDWYVNWSVITNVVQ